MKTEFFLDSDDAEHTGSNIKIIGHAPKHRPYVSVNISNQRHSLFIEDKDLERFAVNILKALKSKRLKQ